MYTDPQMSLFGEGRMPPPLQDTTPTPEQARERLASVLQKLREAESMPFSDRDARMWTDVVPNMTKWLPDDEAEAIRAEFTNLMARFSGES